MSSQTEIQALVAKNSRLQAQFEIAESMSASTVTELESKIKSLEQKIAALELDKRMSAVTVNAQALQPAMATAFSDPALRDENARLQQELAAKDAIIAAKDTTIAERDEQLSQLLRTISSCRETFDQVLCDTVKGETAPKEHEPPKEPTPKVAVAEPDSSAKTISTSPATGSNDDSRTAHPTQSAGLTPAKFPIDVAPASTVFSIHSQAIWTSLENLSPRRADSDQKPGPFSIIQAKMSARKEAQQQALSKFQTQQISQKPNRAHNSGNGSERGNPPGRGNLPGHWNSFERGNLPGRGRLPTRRNIPGRGNTLGRGDLRPNKGQTLHDQSFKDGKSVGYPIKAGPQPTQMTQPANVDERTESGVTKVTGGTNYPNLNRPTATSESSAEQVLTNKGEETSSDLIGDATPFVPKSTSIEDLQKQTRLTAREIEVYQYYGYALPSVNDVAGAIPQSVAQPVPKTPQYVVPDAKSSTESYVASGLEGVMTPSGQSTSRNTPGIQKVEPDSSLTPQSSANKRLPPPDSIKEASNGSSAKNSQEVNVAATHSKVSSQFPLVAAVDKDRKDLTGLWGETAHSIAESNATAVPGTGGEWDAETPEVFRHFGYRLPTRVDQTQAAIQDVTPPARESEGTSSIMRKRSVDDEQPGTSASSKRVRST